ncbi:MAG: type II toxin-antitoxin system RelE/ParE family toxin [Sulfurimonas sp.]
MIIIETNRYKRELRDIAFFIKKDKLGASIKFVQELKESINNLVNFPCKYRKSKYFEDENIRDMIFSGYTVIYEIFEDRIEILTIFNQNLPLK